MPKYTVYCIQTVRLVTARTRNCAYHSKPIARNSKIIVSTGEKNASSGIRTHKARRKVSMISTTPPSRWSQRNPIGFYCFFRMAENVIYFTIYGKLVLFRMRKIRNKISFTWDLSGLNWLSAQNDSSAIRWQHRTSDDPAYSWINYWERLPKPPRHIFSLKLRAYSSSYYHFFHKWYS